MKIFNSSFFHRHGISLFELLVAAGISLLVLSLVFVVLLESRRLQTFNQKTLQFRNISSTLQGMAYQLEHKAIHLYAPQPEDLFRPEGVSQLVVGEKSGKMIGYVFSKKQSSLLQIVYSSAFKPEQRSTLKPQQIKVLAHHVASAEFKVDPYLLLTLKVVPQGSRKSLLVKVPVPWLQEMTP